MLLGKPLAAAWQKKPAMIHVRSAVGASFESTALDRATIGESSFTMRRTSRSIRSADLERQTRTKLRTGVSLRRRTSNIPRSPGRKNFQNRLREGAPFTEIRPQLLISNAHPPHLPHLRTEPLRQRPSGSPEYPTLITTHHGGIELLEQLEALRERVAARRAIAETAAPRVAPRALIFPRRA
jgi:hypothetical protein